MQSDPLTPMFPAGKMRAAMNRSLLALTLSFTTTLGVLSQPTGEPEWDRDVWLPPLVATSHADDAESGFFLWPFVHWKRIGSERRVLAYAAVNARPGGIRSTRAPSRWRDAPYAAVMPVRAGSGAPEHRHGGEMPPSRGDARPGGIRST